jgi:hypothetical protein
MKMIENYMNLNGIWTPVLIVQSDTTQTYGDTITDGDIRYSVTPLKSTQTGGKYTYYFVIRGKERLVLPDDAKQQISDLQSANTALGQQAAALTLANTSLGKQVSQLTLANTTLGKQVAALSIKMGGK